MSASHRIVVPITEAEKVVLAGLVHTHGINFALGYWVVEGDELKFRTMAGTALLRALESCASFKIEGSGAQTLFGKVLRLNARVVN